METLSLAPVITVVYFVLGLAATYVEWRGAMISVMLKEIWWRVVERARVARVHPSVDQDLYSFGVLTWSM